MTTDPATNDQAEHREDRAPGQIASYWQIQLELAERQHQEWKRDGRRVVERYKSERSVAQRRGGSGRRLNILYSNTEVLRAALYGRAAKPDVRRRFADNDPIARQAAEVIERALIYCAETYDVDKPIEQAILDYLLPGRGIVRIEYEPIVRQRPVLDPMTGAPALDPRTGAPRQEDFVAEQKLRERHVFWEDFLCSPARNWEGVTWVAFRHTMTRAELRENRFAQAGEIPLNWQPELDGRPQIPEHLKKAEVWEIWDSERRERLWIVKGCTWPCRVDPDPYGLDGFFPLPEPPSAYLTTDSIVPEPEFHAYQDQADDLDEIVSRISRLTRALKRRGIYDQAVKELARLATAGDNVYIPVENYAALTQKGGLQAAFQTEDISSYAAVLRELYLQRDQLIQAIYEVMGIADIMRGNSDPAETLGAQELKAQFGSNRLRRRQRAIQKWIRDLYKLKAEIIAEHFEPHVLQEMVGVPVTPQVVALLRNDKLRSYRIDIETDSTIFEDDAKEKQSRIEVLTAISGFLERAVPAATSHPPLAPLLFELLSFGIRSFKAGRALEDLIDQTKNQLVQAAGSGQPRPNPTEQRAAAEMQRDQQAHALDMQRKQLDLQAKVVDLKTHQAKAQTQMQRLAEGQGIGVTGAAPFQSS